MLSHDPPVGSCDSKMVPHCNAVHRKPQQNCKLPSLQVLPTAGAMLLPSLLMSRVLDSGDVFLCMRSRPSRIHARIHWTPGQLLQLPCLAHHAQTPSRSTAKAAIDPTE